jgi:prevent-host-death family protein
MRWQLQEAKQRFSELVRTAHDDGPQVVTRHGEDVAVVVAIDDYRQMTRRVPDFKQFLLSGPDLSVLDIERSTETARVVEFG